MNHIATKEIRHLHGVSIRLEPHTGAAHHRDYWMIAGKMPLEGLIASGQVELEAELIKVLDGCNTVSSGHITGKDEVLVLHEIDR